MKRNIKVTLSTLCMLMFTFACASKISAKEFEVNLLVNDNEINFTKETGIPFAGDEGRTFVPIRIAMESMGVLVDWNNDTKEAILEKDDKTVIVTLNSNIIKVNDEEVLSDVPAVAFDGRTYLPIRIVAEAFSAKVDWIQETKTVVITSTEEELEKIEEEIPEAVDEEITEEEIDEITLEELEEELDEELEEEIKTNAYIKGSNINIRFDSSTGSEKEDEKMQDGDEIQVLKVKRISGINKWYQFDFNGNERWLYGDFVVVTNWDDIEIDETNFCVPEEGVIDPPYEEGRLTRSAGRKVNHDGREETFYDLPMVNIYDNLWEITDENGNLKFPKEDYPAWIDEYGYKKFGPYVIVAANWDLNPFGTLVNSSAGTAIVGDTGAFVATNPTGLDIATNWSHNGDDPLY